MPILVKTNLKPDVNYISDEVSGVAIGNGLKTGVDANENGR